jgi:DNA polymerase II
MSFKGFILSNSQVIRDNATQLVFQGRLSDGKRFHWTITNPGAVFFINRSQTWTPPRSFRKKVKLRSLRGDPVDALYFRNTPDLTRARNACESRNFPTYEGDINLAARFLMERFIKGGVAFESEPVRTENNILYFVDPNVKDARLTPCLKLLSIDIECSMALDLYSIALYGDDIACVLMVDPEMRISEKGYQSFPGEKELLASFFHMVRAYDPDAFIGWNLIGFDLKWLSQKCAALEISFDIGTDGPAELLNPGSYFNQWVARIPGRAAMDGIPMVRSAFLKTEDYSLATVAEHVLGQKKLIETSGQEKVAEITRLFNTDKPSLARYNLEDTKLVYDIFERLNLAPLAVRRTQLTGLALDRVGGSVAAFDFLYLPRLHRKGYVADTHPQPPENNESAPGGLVLESVPGFYSNVAVFDFKSLYPSIIRTFRIDPLAANIVLHHLSEGFNKTDSTVTDQIVKGPAGLEFAGNFSILPSIIEDLWHAREKAKASKDPTLSQAVKIIMNSFYGVLGSSGCRFYDPRIAGTITRIGHWNLTISRKFIEKEGYPVIYGDTDSLFIHLGDGDPDTVLDMGNRLSKKLNEYLGKELQERFRVESRLDVEFERIFKRFFMPTIRGRSKGSKKRYAGLLIDETGSAELYFSGMESSRRDWTGLAKEFQADLFTLLFSKEVTTDLEAALCELVRNRHRQLFNGELDQKLVYRKGISKRLEDYTKNVPPHVRAARMLGRLDGRVIRYVMTPTGPEPIQKRINPAYDYEHYSQKQLEPVADMVLQFFDLDYRSLVGGGKQLNLFGNKKI